MGSCCDSVGEFVSRTWFLRCDRKGSSEMIENLRHLMKHSANLNRVQASKGGGKSKRQIMPNKATPEYVVLH